MKPTGAVLAVCLLNLAGLSAASATSYVPVSDPNLADQAAAIATVKVLDVMPGPANRTPSTDYLVEVEQLVQGYLPGSTVVVRVPGGERADGIGLKIWGAPELLPGEEALLFLQPAADGTFGILHLMLGVFHARFSGDDKVAVRDLSGADSVGPQAGPDEARTVRDLDRFAAWLADRAAGLEREPDYWRERPRTEIGEVTGAYTLLTTSDGLAVRWFSFDAGKNVTWMVNSAGQPGLDLSQTVESFQAALAVWTDDPTSSIQYVYGGLTGATGGLRSTDNVNAILFDDPGNVHISGTFSCSAGGVLAVGGPFYYTSTRSYRGQSYHEAIEANVVTNDGTECYFRNNPVVAAEVFAHELGHTLGLGHSADSRSLMRLGAHNDGRGARLEDDDRLAASMIYGDGSFQPAPPQPTAPAATLTISGSAMRAAIALSWENPFDDLAGLRVESQQKNGSYKVLQTLPGSATATTVGGLAANKVYALRVTAVAAGGAVTASSNVVKVRTRK